MIPVTAVLVTPDNTRHVKPQLYGYDRFQSSGLKRAIASPFRNWLPVERLYFTAFRCKYLIEKPIDTGNWYADGVPCLGADYSKYTIIEFWRDEHVYID